jgi:hypothetical protein
MQTLSRPYFRALKWSDFYLLSKSFLKIARDENIGPQNRLSRNFFYVGIEIRKP